MKRIIVSILIACIALPAMAQDGDDYLPHWYVGVNLMGGALQQKLSHTNYISAYSTPVNASLSDLKSIGQSSVEGDFELGFFWGEKRHLGIGTGIMLVQQQSSADLAKFHVEYQSFDYNNDVFRQSVTAKGAIHEQIKTAVINIPLLFKYQTRFSDRTGFMVDAGILYSAVANNSYSSTASFDYEAIYKFNQSGDGARTVYDNAPVANNADWMIIQSQYTANELAVLRTRGYNVGAAVIPTQLSGTVAYKKGIVGWLIRPAISYRVGHNIFFQGGVHCMMQTYTQDVPLSIKLTDKVGEYNSMLRSVRKSENITYGLNIGVRFVFGRAKDKDGDGISDRKDKCPDVEGILKFSGCPDTDGDGIPDPEDSCRKLAGIELYHGCPDTDGDGIPDNKDACPHVKGIANFRGCPDSDGDGVPDNKDECPDVPGTVAAHGCPDSDNDGVADKNDDCPELFGSVQNYGCPYDSSKDIQGSQNGQTAQPHGHSIPTHTLLKQDMINYKSGKSEIDPASIDILDEAIEALSKDPNVIIYISGYTDDIGSDVSNLLLSISRAESVNKYFLSKGIPPKRIIISGYGKKSPIVENNSAENRAKNRRIELKLLLPIK